MNERNAGKKFQWDRPTTSVRELEKGPCGNRVWERESGRKEKEKTIVSNDERHKNIGDDLEWMRLVVALDIVVALGVVAVVGRRVKRRSNKISPSARPLIKKICLPPAFFIYFHLFIQTFQFLQQVHVKKCPSSIQCWDLNPQPSGAESPPITTRPWLPYKVRKLFAQIAILEEYLLPAPMMIAATLWEREMFDCLGIDKIIQKMPLM